MTAPATGNPLVLEGLELPGTDGLGPLPHPDRRRPPRWRALWTWSATSAPVGLLILAGIAVGPRGTNLLSLSTLSLLDPVVPVALAALGVLVGLSANDRRMGEVGMLGTAALASAVAALVVSAGFGIVALAATSPVAPPLWILILLGGICAAPSLTLPADHSLQPRPAAARFVELGAVLPVVAGGLMLAWLRTGSAADAGVLVARACGVTVAAAAAAWLLLTRASPRAEERVFAVAALLLVGGVAAAISVAALFGGLVAGLFWRYAGRHPREAIRADVLFVQHPLLVLVLLVAGARADLSYSSLALGAGYIALRAAAQLTAGALAQRVAGLHAPRNLGLHLLPPGVFGVGCALNAREILGAEASMLLGVVVVGTIGSELLAVVLSPRSPDE